MAKLTPSQIEFNIHTIEWLAGTHEYDLKVLSQYHYRAFLPKGTLDYWPHTGKARYLTAPNNYFVIKDIESFVNKQYQHGQSKTHISN